MELITIQVGTLANYVGAHFWNMQDEYVRRYQSDEEEKEGVQELDMTRLFRRGQLPNGMPTVTPRLVAFDFVSMVILVRVSE